MMINKRLIGMVSDSKKQIARNVAFQWVALVANILLILTVAAYLAALAEGRVASLPLVLAIAAAMIGVRFFCAKMATKCSYQASHSVKQVLRRTIFDKLLRLGPSYSSQVATSEVVQVTVEGVEQLETYFGSYLPQFFYSMLAPLTLFVVLAPISLSAAVVLLICVPLIPISIAAVQTFAKKLLSRYWGQYTALGDNFLENLQGLTTLKIYQSDAHKHQQMNEEAEHFRRITMKVLTMQLNSITIMDLVAYGGAALGMVVAARQFAAGQIDLFGCFAIVMLSADFFLPMRLLGSFFHIAMNGMAATEKIFRLLDLPEPEPKTGTIQLENCPIQMKDVTFAYDENRTILHGVDMELPQTGLVALVGASGCGKSTLAGLLSGRLTGYTGNITIGGQQLSEISTSSLMQDITTVGFSARLFKGSVAENLRMAAPNATDDQLWQVLEQVKLADFLRAEQGLDTQLAEKAANLSGGQCQRLALARALLHDSPIYIFDEATSNIDVESENQIMASVHQLARHKAVLLISHRLANVTDADCIYALEQGHVMGKGTHQELLAHCPTYQALWNSQQALERYTHPISQEDCHEKAL
ncbi:MAG: ABC transporter ATP-binding protein/permease [Candidatus Fournierella pullistercoris]|uniref:ABC transporter ATP-binding protein/permease n=1 Tax=Candidatus Allofournierella pullistercoris TaxID=2838597 RepID=A0A948WUX8_9FIRM|nr:ABC transporter ATP-binding protein/permease [Candidatus Fournierella pullistercoris]